jgi:hypothetical protein
LANNKNGLQGFIISFGYNVYIPFVLKSKIKIFIINLCTNISNNQIQTSFSLTGNNITQGLGTVALSAGAGALIGGIAGPAGAIAGAALGIGIGVVGAVNTQGFNINLKIPTAGTGGTDFLLRGGTLLPGIIANDEERLAKFFKSTDGVLFTVKQNLLSRIAVRTQASTGLLNDGVYTPISTLLEAAGNPFGLHVNKQGLNPLNPTTYFDVIKDKILPIDTNRLSSLYDNILVNNTGLNNFGFTRGTTLNDGNNILSYQGGPDSVLGIGKTHIRFATDNIGAPLKTRNTKTNNALDYKQLENISNETYVQNSSYKGTQITDFRKFLKQDLNKTIFSISPPYSGSEAKNIEQRVNLGDPGNPSGKDLTSYTRGINEGQAGPNTFDKINASILYQSEGPQGTNNPNPDAVNNDLVKFRIGVIDNDTPNKKTYIHFRAFLDQISDAYTADWQSTKYIGRGENFYTYGGFDRKVSLGWTVAAQSKVELIPMYKKLNYLASICAPDYGSYGYMRGNIVTLTIGGYFYEQPGIIMGFNYEMNDESDSWEIGIDDEGKSDNLVKELPHIIRVRGFNFIPIHNFVPRKQINTYQQLDSDVLNDGNTYGPQRYIALSAGGNTNYE